MRTSTSRLSMAVTTTAAITACVRNTGVIVFYTLLSYVESALIMQ